jgi:hypothetical protein
MVVSPKKQRLADVTSPSRTSKSTKSTNKILDDNLTWDDEVFKDAYLMDLEIADDADLKNGIQFENPFAFGN